MDELKFLDYEALKSELEKSVEQDRLKTQFFATLSHELKTPINIILSSIQLLRLQNGEDESPDAKLHRYIEQNAYRLLRLVTNLIDLSKIDSSFIHPIFKSGDIFASLSSVTDSCESYAAAKGISLTYFGPRQSDAMLFDPYMLDRVMLNLLSNSIKYTDKGGIIAVRALNEADFVRVEVADSGCGIPAEELASIFDPFRLVHMDFRRECDGSGLGLSIVKDLVEMHGGTVEVQSTQGAGSRFTFTISKALAAPAPLSHGGTQRSFDYDEDMRKTKVSIEMSNS